MSYPGAVAFVVAATVVCACSSEPSQNGPVTTPDEPARVTSITPTSGAYGDEFVIEGTGFGTVAKLLEFKGSDGKTREFSSTAWTDTRIAARMPFPVDGKGAISFCNRHPTAPRGARCLPGETRVEAGTFTVTSTFRPGIGQRFAGSVLAARVLGDGSVAAVSSGDGTAPGARLVVLGDKSVAPQPIPNLPVRPHRIVILESADGRPEVVATSSAGTVMHHRWKGEALESMDAGVSGQVIEGGRDDAGRFVWVSNEMGTRRLRIDSSWSADRTIGSGARTGALAGDGTLVVLRTVRSGDTITGYRYRLHALSLAPAASDFVDLGEASTEAYDDGFPWVDVATSGDARVLLVSFCAAEGGSTNCDHRRVRDASGWTNAPRLTAQGVITVSGDALASAYGDDRGIVVRRDHAKADGEQLVPLWPVKPVAVLFGATDVRVLVRDGFDVYAPRAMP